MITVQPAILRSRSRCCLQSALAFSMPCAIATAARSARNADTNETTRFISVTEINDQADVAIERERVVLGRPFAVQCPVATAARFVVSDTRNPHTRRAYLCLRRRELMALSSLSSTSALRMLRASRKISTQDNSST
jgi:hypothetical protein